MSVGRKVEDVVLLNTFMRGDQTDFPPLAVLRCHALHNGGVEAVKAMYIRDQPLSLVLVGVGGAVASTMQLALFAHSCSDLANLRASIACVIVATSSSSSSSSSLSLDAPPSLPQPTPHAALRWLGVSCERVTQRCGAGAVVMCAATQRAFAAAFGATAQRIDAGDTPLAALDTALDENGVAEARWYSLSDDASEIVLPVECYRREGGGGGGGVLCGAVGEAITRAAGEHASVSLRQRDAFGNCGTSVARAPARRDDWSCATIALVSGELGRAMRVTLGAPGDESAYEVQRVAFDNELVALDTAFAALALVDVVRGAATALPGGTPRLVYITFGTAAAAEAKIAHIAIQRICGAANVGAGVGAAAIATRLKVQIVPSAELCNGGDANSLCEATAARLLAARHDLLQVHSGLRATLHVYAQATEPLAALGVFCYRVVSLPPTLLIYFRLVPLPSTTTLFYHSSIQTPPNTNLSV
jgi:hypothetical protein